MHFYISPLDPHGHQFSVRLELDVKQQDTAELKLPAWIPGSYMIRDFARNILDLYAEADGKSLPVTALDKQTWRIDCSAARVMTVRYQVYAFDLSVRSAYLDQFWGFFNNSSLCLAVNGRTEEPIELTLELSEKCENWRVATGMPRLSGEAFGAGRFKAESYEELIDYPFLLGNLGIHEFIAGGIKHAFVTAGRNFADVERICGDLARICEQQIELFEKQVPFESYLFLTMVVGKGFGGLEHRNSTALMCSRRDLVSPGVRTSIDSDYRTFLSLCSHEYFHSWNIKTLKPRDFIPYSLEAEQYTRQLWFYEGITSYFDDFILQQAGLIDAATYLGLIGDTLARVHRGVGVDRHTVGDSSLQAWNRFYKQDENAPNAVVSYYAKGALIALCLDLLIRSESRYEHTLGDCMAKFWTRFGAPQMGTLDSSFAEFIHETYGIHLGAFIERAVNTTEPLPVAELLEQFGVVIERKVAQDDNTFGGRAAASPLPVALGAKYKAGPQGLELQVVFADEAAQTAGLSAQDRVIAIDHLQVTDSNLREIFERYQPGDVVPVHAFRRDELIEVELIWQEPKLNNYLLKVADKVKAQRWLRC